MAMVEISRFSLFDVNRSHDDCFYVPWPGQRWDLVRFLIGFEK